MAPAKSRSAEMPFLDHLEELRWRLIYSLGTLVVGFVIGFVLVLRFNVLRAIQKPVLPYLGGNYLMSTNPMDALSINMQLALFVALALALPVVMYQVWAFLAPALHAHEKRIVVPVLAVGTLLFCIGVAIAYFFVLPLTLSFMYALGQGSLTVMWEVSKYFGLVIGMCLAFGLSFEVPLAIVALSALGLIDPRTLAKARRYAAVVVFIGASIISPGDMVTVTFALAVPLYLLYELAVVVAFVIDRRKRRKAERQRILEAGAGA
jgi:sec-independent protein translocase protein TatC